MYLVCGIELWVTQDCSIWLLILVLCRRLWWTTWGCWCLYWGLWLESICTEGRYFWTISQWYWLFTGILFLGRAPWKNRIRVSGCPLFCKKTRDVPLQSRVCLISVVWLSFGTLYLFCGYIPTLCSLECCLVILGTNSVLLQYQPRLAPVKGVSPNATSSLWRFWPRSYVFWMLGTHCLSGVCIRYFAVSQIVSYITWCTPS